MPEAPTDEPGAATVAATGTVGRATVGATAWPPADLVAAAVDALRNPGLVVIAGAPGTGRSTVLNGWGAFRGTVFAGGALAMLRGVPALPLSRAVRVRLPSHEAPLLAEAVRSRVRHGLLLLDDLQWADPLTIAALPAIAEHCRIAVTLRTPHRLPGDAEQVLRAASTAWLNVPPMPADAAAALVRQIAPGASTTVVVDLVRRAGGVPLAVTALAKHVAQGGTPSTRTRASPTPSPEPSPTSTAPPAPRWPRSACSAGPSPRPSSAKASPSSPRPASSRSTPPGSPRRCRRTPPRSPPASSNPPNASRCTGASPGSSRPGKRPGTSPPPARPATPTRSRSRRARTAASTGERAELLLLACDLPGVTAAADVRLDAARAALAAGRPGSCLRVLPALVAEAAADPAVGAVAAVLRGEALLQQGNAAAAAQAVTASVTTPPPTSSAPATGSGSSPPSPATPTPP